jgi:hypothetical protein
LASLSIGHHGNEVLQLLIDRLDPLSAKVKVACLFLTVVIFVLALATSLDMNQVMPSMLL